MLLLLGSLMEPTGVHGPMVSRVTSALAIGALGILVTLVVVWPWSLFCRRQQSLT